MRDIKFRGKRIDNGEWVEGYYYKAKYCRTDDIALLLVSDSAAITLSFPSWLLLCRY